MNPQLPESKKALKETLLERIEREKMCPRSRLFFQGRECLVWSVWFISVVVGALAIAVSAFVVTHRQYELYEATHENFLTFFVEVLPYVWIIVFGIMVFVSVYNLHHTKRGYRYPVSIIIVSSFILSFVGGSALQMFGFGYIIDDILGRSVGMYLSQEKLEQKLWQAPPEGRLIGKQVLTTVSPSLVVFEDMSGQRWTMEISELQKRDVDLLTSGQTVRLLGVTKDDELGLFHACGAFPWMINGKVTVNDLNKERQTFIERLQGHARQVNERLALRNSQTFASTTIPQPTPCASLVAVSRVPMVMQ